MDDFVPVEFRVETGTEIPYEEFISTIKEKLTSLNLVWGLYPVAWISQGQNFRGREWSGIGFIPQALSNAEITDEDVSRHYRRWWSLLQGERIGESKIVKKVFTAQTLTNDGLQYLLRKHPGDMLVLLEDSNGYGHAVNVGPEKWTDRETILCIGRSN